MLGKALQLKTTILLVFEKLIVDHLEKCGLFSDFQYCFRSSRSTADLLTVVSDRITRAFNRSGATRAVALDISKAFDRVWYAGVLHKLNDGVPQGSIFGPTLFVQYVNDFPDDVICDVAIYADDTIYAESNNLRWLLNLNLIYETLWTGAGSGLLI